MKTYLRVGAYYLQSLTRGRDGIKLSIVDDPSKAMEFENEKKAVTFITNNELLGSFPEDLMID